MSDKAVQPTTLAYLAGIIDGDGFVSITRSIRNGVVYFAAQVGIGNTQRAPLDLAAAIWGGKVCSYAPRNLRHRTQFQWQRMERAAGAILTDLQPYLLLKSEHAKLAIELQTLLDAQRRGEPVDAEALHAMREQMIEMNQSRNRSRRFPGRNPTTFPNMEATNANS